MNIFNIIVCILLGGFILWRLVGFIRSKPETLSGASLNKSFLTMGVVALLLIIFIGCIAYIV